MEADRMTFFRKNRALLLIFFLFLLFFSLFVYTFVQPRYSGTITEVGPSHSVSDGSWRKGRRGSHTSTPLTVSYRDAQGREQTVRVAWSQREGIPQPGQQAEIVHSVRGPVLYPDLRMRMVYGSLALAAGMFLFFSVLDPPGKEKKAPG